MMSLSIDAPPPTPNYRLVVTASSKAKQFVWVIVDDNHRGNPVQASRQTYRSMEDAYNAGKGALEYLRAKMQRIISSVDLAQSSTPITTSLPAKQRADRAPRRSLTSSIYSRG
jgi:hypothetical protein